MTVKESRAGYARVAERSFGLCESCGWRQATQMHHRLHRSHGGDENPANLIHLCLWCHSDAHTRTDRYATGMAVRSGYDPALLPVVYRGVLSVLTADGGLA
jgi:5-methylcytosine-specific restriction endonuclease McrA